MAERPMIAVDMVSLDQSCVLVARFEFPGSQAPRPRGSRLAAGCRVWSSRRIPRFSAIFLRTSLSGLSRSPKYRAPGAQVTTHAGVYSRVTSDCAGPDRQCPQAPSRCGGNRTCTWIRRFSAEFPRPAAGFACFPAFCRADSRPCRPSAGNTSRISGWVFCFSSA